VRALDEIIICEDMLREAVPHLLAASSDIATAWIGLLAAFDAMKQVLCAVSRLQPRTLPDTGPPAPQPNHDLRAAAGILALLDLRMKPLCHLLRHRGFELGVAVGTTIGLIHGTMALLDRDVRASRLQSDREGLPRALRGDGRGPGNSRRCA
jgi:hypothetical protein